MPASRNTILTGADKKLHPSTVPAVARGAVTKYALHNDDYQDMSLTADVYVDFKAA